MALGPLRHYLSSGRYLLKHNFLRPISSRNISCTCIHWQNATEHKTVTVRGREYPCDDWTNVRPRILELMERQLHRTSGNPLCLLKQRLVNYLHRHYPNHRGNPVFSIFEDLSPVVTLEQNFDSLLTPPDHVSRANKESYYLNSKFMLRAHTSAHQAELLRSGLDAFAVVGDVYRRDDINPTHYPAFHQMEGVKLYTAQELFGDSPKSPPPRLFTGAPSSTPPSPPSTPSAPTASPQPCHTPAAVEAVSARLRECLEGMAASVFGKGIETRWVPAHFPFTQPSWELEVWYGGQWMEVLGCGVVHQRILEDAGCGARLGWAFGLGLERWAMALYGVPDIRVFWSQDPGVTRQWQGRGPGDAVAYAPVSKFIARPFNLSVWLEAGRQDSFDERDLCSVVRETCGDLVEQVDLKSKFVHPKTGLTSYCINIIYRSMDRHLEKPEAKALHAAVVRAVEESLPVRLC